MNWGYIKLHRKIWNHPFWKEKRVYSKFEAWVYLLLQAKGKDEEVKDAEGRKVYLKRGQFLSSARELAQKWGWSKSKTNRFLKLLQVGQKMGQAISAEPGRLYSQKTGQAKSIITILNYNKYNPLKKKSGTAEDSESGTEIGTLNKERDKQSIRDSPSVKIKTSDSKGKLKKEDRDKDHENFLRQINQGRSN